MSHSSKLISLGKPFVLIALVMFCLPGCSSKPYKSLEDLKRETNDLIIKKDFPKALKSANAMLAKAEKDHGALSRECADCWLGYGKVQVGVKDYRKAAESFDKAAEIFTSLKAEAPILAQALFAAGANLAEVNEFDQAEERMARGIQILNNTGDENSFNIISASTDLASMWLRRGRTKDAEDLLQNLLKPCRNDPKTPPNILARILNNLGEIRYLRGDYGDALDYYQQALDLAQAKMPENDQMISVFKKNVENAKGKMKK